MENIFKSIPNEMRGQKETFRPGEHIIVKRVTIDSNKLKNLVGFHAGGRLSIPEGYQLVTFQTHSALDDIDFFNTYSKVYIDIWLINNKRVEVQSVWNETTNQYYYCEPGKVVETLIPEEGPSLYLRKERSE